MRAARWSRARSGGAYRENRSRLRVIPSRRGPALSRAVRSNVNPNAFIFTDDWQAYKPLAREFTDHRVVNHSAGEYVRGDDYTNTIEGYFSIFKRGIVGTYHSVSQQHLKRYLAEFDFRYSYRVRLGYDDATRTEIAI